jgi:hypothetical protein
MGYNPARGNRDLSAASPRAGSTAFEDRDSDFDLAPTWRDRRPGVGQSTVP